MNRIARALFIAAGLLGLLTGAASGDDATGKTDPSAVAQVGEFATDFLPRLEGENVLTSPYLVSSAFALLRVGARGETQAQMDKVFHFPKRYVFPKLTEGGKDKGDPGTMLLLSSMLFVDQHMKLNREFLQTAKERFGTVVSPVDLHNANAAADAINSAVSKATKGKIRTVVSGQQLQESRTNAFVLAQALYFKGKWQVQFDKKDTKAAAFHGVKGDRRVAMMNMPRGYFAYGHFDGIQAVKVPFAGKKYSLLILLPDNVKGFAGMAQRPDVGHVQKMIGMMKPQRVNLSLPRFSLVEKHDLRVPLAEMGMRDAFVQGKADFSGMTGSGAAVSLAFATEDIVFAVDEEGTEAASAVTVGGLFSDDTGHPSPPPPIVFRVDHPCVMVVVDDASGIPLFVVRLASPPEWLSK